MRGGPPPPPPGPAARRPEEGPGPARPPRAARRPRGLAAEAPSEPPARPPPRPAPGAERAGAVPGRAAPCRPAVPRQVAGTGGGAAGRWHPAAGRQRRGPAHPPGGSARGCGRALRAPLRSAPVLLSSPLRAARPWPSPLPSRGKMADKGTGGHSPPSVGFSLGSPRRPGAVSEWCKGDPVGGGKTGRRYLQKVNFLARFPVENFGSVCCG